MKCLRGAAGICLGTTIKCLPIAAGIDLGTTVNYLHCAAIIGLGTTIRHLRRTASAAAGNGLGATAKYLRRATSGAVGNDWAQRSSNCDAHRAAPRATVHAPPGFDIGRRMSRCPGMQKCHPRPTKSLRRHSNF
jgi:hypothetical protein